MVIRRGFSLPIGLIITSPYKDDYSFRGVIWSSGAVSFEHVRDLIDIDMLVPYVD